MRVVPCPDSNSGRIGFVEDGKELNSRKGNANPVTSFVDSSEAAFASLLFYPIVGHGIGRLAGSPWS